MCWFFAEVYSKDYAHFALLCFGDDFAYGFSQWEMTLQCKVVPRTIHVFGCGDVNEAFWPIPSGLLHWHRRNHYPSASEAILKNVGKCVPWIRFDRILYPQQCKPQQSQVHIVRDDYHFTTYYNGSGIDEWLSRYTIDKTQLTGDGLGIVQHYHFQKSLDVYAHCAVY